MNIFYHVRPKQVAVQQRKNESELTLRQLAFCDLNEIYEKFKTGEKGLAKSEAEDKLEEFGPNIITSEKERGVVGRLIESFVNPFNIVLFLVATISFITDVILSTKKDYLTVIIILSLIIVSSMIAFIQGERSNAAAASLSKMISNKVDLIRDGILVECKMEDVVVGDLVKLYAGDIIPGDVRFIKTKDAFIAQAALTGESNPVEKFAQIDNETNIALTDIENLGFMGSNMVSGSAEAIVLATGNDTYFGSMAKSLSGERSKNSFERGVDSVSMLLIRFMLIMVPIIFFVNGVTKGDWGNSLLFAVTMAVGLTPEMLPVIMSSTLAKGAVMMAKRQTIVKSLSAIQTFGEMDVLCTDKTGTLTEDKIILERYMNVQGNDDSRVLRHAYLNSFFQTGLKNLIDFAVINRGNENNLHTLQTEYTRVDEIPFDFDRRRMSVVLKDKTEKRQLITKGAVEEILSICSYVDYNGETLPLDEDLLAKAMAVYEKHNKDGLRIVAVAQKNDVADIEVFGIDDESEMVLLGFIGFLDPPKESSKAAIKALKDHGVRVIVLTGDSEGVAVKVCKKVGVNTEYCLSGIDVEEMDEMQLDHAVRNCDLFSKLSPDQKKRVVMALQKNGHTVGYMGDGINDAPALRQADVGISVDSAVDIAKETADIILLKKDLMVLEEGVIEGRKTFGNIMKYIKMAASGNFGNMISVMVASVFLPFLPMLPVHILTQNLLCDFSQMGIPFDNVDDDYIKKPRRWETSGIQKFMIIMGPISSLFDIACFAVLWWIIGANTEAEAQLFRTGWFIFGTISQIVIAYMIRTRKIPFIQSNASIPFMLSTISIIIITLFVTFTNLAIGLDLVVMPIIFIPWLILLLLGYSIATQVFKMIYIKWIGEWL